MLETTSFVTKLTTCGLKIWGGTHLLKIILGSTRAKQLEDTILDLIVEQNLNLEGIWLFGTTLFIEKQTNTEKLNKLQPICDRAEIRS